MLKEFRGHTSFVNAAIFSMDQTQVVSASSDGSVRIWDVRSGDCLHTFRGLASSNADGTGSGGAASGIGGSVDTGINSIQALPRRPGHYIVVSRTNTIQLINVKGEVSVGGDVNGVADS